MAKHGNKPIDKGGEPKGPCHDCGATEGPFHPVMRCSPTGKRRMIKLCTKCRTVIGAK